MLEMRNSDDDDQWFIFKKLFQNQKILLTIMVTRWIKCILKKRKGVASFSTNLNDNPFREIYKPYF